MTGHGRFVRSSPPTVIPDDKRPSKEPLVFSVLKHLSIRLPNDRDLGRLPRLWVDADDQWNRWYGMEVPGLITIGVCPGEMRDDRWFTLGQSDRTHLWFTSPDYAFNAGVPFEALHIDPDQCIYTQLDQHDLGRFVPTGCSSWPTGFSRTSSTSTTSTT